MPVNRPRSLRALSNEGRTSHTILSCKLSAEGVVRFPLPYLTTRAPRRLTSGVDSPTPASDPASAATGSYPDTSTDTSRHQMPAGSNTPTGTVEVPGRNRSGTIIARPIWDPTVLAPRWTHRTCDRQGTISASTSRNGRGRQRSHTGRVEITVGVRLRDADRVQGGRSRASRSPSPPGAHVERHCMAIFAPLGVIYGVGTATSSFLILGVPRLARRVIDS
ncbi:hypothetical protein EDB85DRAFT_583342 [Lactarius pseudohatsudake]|nr:hypothetical protein EDB85DRAFT_583342 [Lactarius pseudohatsudake]